MEASLEILKLRFVERFLLVFASFTTLRSQAEMLKLTTSLHTPAES